MKKGVLFAIFCLAIFKGFGQDGEVAPVSISANIFRVGATVQPYHSRIEAPHGYGLMYGKPRPRFFYGVDINVFIYEKYGIRIGADFSGFSYSPRKELSAYIESEHAGYKTPEIPQVNHDYSTVFVELARRFSVGRWRFEPGIHIGRGEIDRSLSLGYIKQNGSNYWKHIQYSNETNKKLWNYGVQTAIYFRHRMDFDFLYVNAHLNLGFYMAFPKYEISYSEQYYGQAETKETFTVKEKVYWFNVSLLANLEWKPAKYRQK